MLDARAHIGRKLDAPGRAVARDYFRQARFVNRDAAAVQQIDLALIDIQAKHVVTEFCQTGPGDQTDVAGSNNRYFHN